MLHQILGVVLLTTCTANFGGAFEQKTPQNNIKQPQNVVKYQQNSSSESSNVDYQLYIERTNHTAEQTEFGSYEKDTYNSYNEFLRAYGNYYIQETSRKNADAPNQYSYIYIKNENTQDTDTDPYCQSMLILQLTPYTGNINNQIHANIDIVIDWSDTLYSEIVGTAKLQVDLYTSVDQAFSNWLDYTTYYSPYFVNERYNDMEDSNLGYTYNHRETEIELNKNSSDQYVQFYDDFYIAAGQTNYLILFITPIVETTTQDENTIQIYSDYAGHSAAIDYNSLNITGTGIYPPNNTEVVDIAGIMFQILAMPWYFISTAFNLTLFPGTAYQINIANLFLAVIAMFIFIFLMGIIGKKLL